MRHRCNLYINKIKQVHGRLLNKALIKENVKDYNAEQSRILEVLWEEGSISNKEISQKSGIKYVNNNAESDGRCWFDYERSR